MKFENMHLRLEQILERKFEIHQGHIQVSGCSSPAALAFFLSQSHSNKINNLPHLVVVGSASEANRFVQTLSTFDSSRYAYVLSSYDENPYSSLYPKSQLVAERLNFFYRAQHAKKGEIFVASIGALLQKSIPFDELRSHSFLWHKNSEIPNNISALLTDLGYSASPLVEDIGHYSIRGGILDIYSPAHLHPVRIELFGDTIESMRFFQAQSQQSTESVQEFHLIPCKEVLWNDDRIESLIEKFRLSVVGRNIDQHEFEETIRSLNRKAFFPGIDFLLPFFYSKLNQPLDHFNSELNIWLLDPSEITRQADQFLSEIKSNYSTSTRQVVRPKFEDFYLELTQLSYPEDSRKISFASILTEELVNHVDDSEMVEYPSSALLEASNLFRSFIPGSEGWLAQVKQKLTQWKSDGYAVFLFVKGKTQSERLKLFFEKCDFKLSVTDPQHQSWQTWLTEEYEDKKLFHLIPRPISESVRLTEEKIIFFS